MSESSGRDGVATVNRVLVGICAVLAVAVLVLVIAFVNLSRPGGGEAASGEGVVGDGGVVQDGLHGGPVENATAAQVSVIRLSDGKRRGTASERYARPALSLAKLYIADYVLDHGTVSQRWEAINMISDSSDAAAKDLYTAYPDSIDATAEKYGLESTRSGEDWGYALTSTYDVATFVARVLDADPTSPILVAMARAADVAEDGYEQNWGTALLPGTIGTKWGWSNDKELHSSVSFSENFVVAAAVTGSSEDLTELVEDRIKGMGSWIGDDAVDHIDADKSNDKSGDKSAEKSSGESGKKSGDKSDDKKSGEKRDEEKPDEKKSQDGKKPEDKSNDRSSGRSGEKKSPEKSSAEPSAKKGER
ncbi:hypothetical protein [Corynebacterium frankenforstense]|uniref:hypothetical protein n=1 Tax=Corynebacterium frankenforstense TaxID=1230998 RepID=UPI0009524631|nr:hypothetical protein [Corynebacterium frankenforstense]